MQITPSLVLVLRQLVFESIFGTPSAHPGYIELTSVSVAWVINVPELVTRVGIYSQGKLGVYTQWQRLEEIRVESRARQQPKVRLVESQANGAELTETRYLFEF